MRIHCISHTFRICSIQYRMHSHISAFPSSAFYQSRLTDGPAMDEKTRQVWHTNPLFPPYAFMHVKGGNEVRGRHHSLSNPVEAATALSIYERLVREYPKVDFDYRIGIVTPYKGQVQELKQVFKKKFGFDILSKVSFNTVDVSALLQVRKFSSLTSLDACRGSKVRRKIL